MRDPPPRRLRKYGAKRRGLKSCLRSSGEGRIPAAALLGALLMGGWLRRSALAALEALVRSRARRAQEVSQRGLKAANKKGLHPPLRDHRDH